MEKQIPPESKLNTGSTTRAWVGWTVFFLLLALVVAFFSGFLPIAPVVVATGSTEPAIHVGDVVMVCRANPDSLEVGDVIRYKGNGCTVIHRIVEIDGDTFITQGDANNAPDLWPVDETQILGRVICTIPNTGKFTLWLHGIPTA